MNDRTFQRNPFSGADYISVGFSNRFSLPHKRHYILGIYTAIFVNMYRYFGVYFGNIYRQFWGIFCEYILTRILLYYAPPKFQGGSFFVLEHVGHPSWESFERFFLLNLSNMWSVIFSVKLGVLLLRNISWPALETNSPFISIITEKLAARPESEAFFKEIPWQSPSFGNQQAFWLPKKVLRPGLSKVVQKSQGQPPGMVKKPRK